MIIKKVVLKVRRLDALAKVYIDKFDLPVLYRDVERMDLQVGHSVLSFNRTEVDDSPFYHFAFSIPRKCLQEARQWLSARAPIIVKEGVREFFYPYLSGAQAIFFTDAGGNVGELISRRERAEFSDRTFGREHLLGIGEIGIPVKDVETVTNQIAEALGLEDLKKKTPQFSTIGDFEGAFDIVPIGRHWMPTDKPAEVFPIEVTILGDKEQSYTLPDYPYTFNVVTE